MATVKISALTSASTPLTGAEVVPVVQSGVTKKVPLTPANIGASAVGHAHSGTYEPVQTPASQAEMEAGTRSAIRSVSPLRVAQAIAALGGGGGISAVQDDTAPILGGDLRLAGHRIVVTDALDAIHGALAYNATVEALFLSENTPGSYLEDKGGIAFQQGLSSIHGSITQVRALVGVTDREVWCDPDGNLFPVVPPPPAWDVEDQSTAKVLASGDDVDGIGNWVRITALECATEANVAMGDPIGCTTRAYINNLSAGNGDIEFGWGVDAAQPTANAGKVKVAVVSGFNGYVTANHYQEALAAYPTGTLVTAWVRGYGTSQFAPWVDGLIQPHYLTIEAVGQAATGGVALHAATHALNQPDAINPAAIGAATAFAYFA